MPPYDRHTNLAYSLVATAPSPATSGTSLVVTAGQGTRFPDPGAAGYSGGYNCLIWPADALPTPANSEVVRVTAVSTDTLTIARAQEGSVARTVIVGDQIAVVPSAKVLTDIEGAAAEVATTDATVTTLATIPIPTDTTVHIEATVVARRTGGAAGAANDGAGYKIYSVLKNTAGTAIVIGTATSVHGESQAGWDAVVDANSSNARIRVTGAVSNDVSWYTIYKLTSFAAV